ncbi:MAG: hypothetical protein LC804_26515 [Acidobacteria bacterium]|nr:hypothetical protein [Acidobacteriota bacterium]
MITAHKLFVSAVTGAEQLTIAASRSLRIFPDTIDVAPATRAFDAIGVTVAPWTAAVDDARQAISLLDTARGLVAQFGENVAFDRNLAIDGAQQKLLDFVSCIETGVVNGQVSIGQAREALRSVGGSFVYAVQTPAEAFSSATFSSTWQTEHAAREIGRRMREAYEARRRAPQP